MTPLIIPVFLPHFGCPQHCLFCNQRATAQEVPSPEKVREFLQASLRYLSSFEKGRQRQVAFYGGSFTALKQEDQISYLREASSFLSSGPLDSIRISTRPDALSEETLGILKTYGVKTIEVGIQSLSDEILLVSRRGHTADDSVSALKRVKDAGFEVGAHLMVGLPGDTLDSFLSTIDRTIELQPDFVRIHPTLVLKGAPLEKIWREGGYAPLSLDESVRWLKKGVLKLERASLAIARIGLHPTEELETHLLAGPFHPALHQLVNSALFYDMAEHLLQRYQNGFPPTLICHPRDLSDLKGQRQENFLKLKAKFKFDHISTFCRENIGRGRLGLRTPKGEVFVDRSSLD